MIRSVMGGGAAVNYVLGSGRGGAAAGNGLLTGLVAYWGLDEASGNALDKHGGGVTLTANNAPGSTTGHVYATVRTFANASAQYFSRASEPALQTGDIDFSFAAWVYPTANARRFVIGKDASTGREYGLMVQSSTQIRFELFAPTSQICEVSGLSLLNGWHLIIAWHDSAGNTSYVQVDNGTPISKSLPGSLSAATNTEFRIGARAYTGIEDYFNGRIGPVAFWKIAR